jgi:hypothetical protein
MIRSGEVGFRICLTNCASSMAKENDSSTPEDAGLIHSLQLCHAKPICVNYLLWLYPDSPVPTVAKRMNRETRSRLNKSFKFAPPCT